MNVKSILACLLFFSTRILAQETIPLNIRTDDESKFIVYVNDVPQCEQPVNALKFSVRSGKATIKVVFQNTSFAPVVQEVDCRGPILALTLKKKDRSYFLDGFTGAVSINAGVVIQSREESCRYCQMNGCSCCSGYGNNNGNGRPPGKPVPGGGHHHEPPAGSPYHRNGSLCRSPAISEMAFLNLKKRISDERYSSGRAKIALQAIERNCFLATQVAAMVKMISNYTNDQFEVAKNGYLHMYNTEDFDIVINEVGSADHRKKLRQFAVNAGGMSPVPLPHPIPETHERPFPRCEQNDCQGFSMNNQKFGQALELLRNTAFDDTRLEQAELITKNNCLSVEQIRAIIRLFSFEEAKLEYAKFSYLRSHDKRNFYLVNKEFAFDLSRSEFTEFMSKN